MGRGLSTLQKRILDILSDPPGWKDAREKNARHWVDDSTEPPNHHFSWTQAGVMRKLGREDTPANRVAIHKSLHRLWSRGLVKGYHANLFRSGWSFKIHPKAMEKVNAAPATIIDETQ